MKAIILAGGYAKRLKPLSDSIPKPLLKVAGKPIIKYILDKLLSLGIDDVVLSTNRKFDHVFAKWLSENGYNNVKTVPDESFREEEKPGAIKALASIVKDVDEDCLVIAGDNIFADDLRGMLECYEKVRSAVIAVYDVKDLSLAKQYSAVEVDQSGRIVSFVEKPEDPKSTLIGTCIYILPRSSLKKLQDYVSEGRNLDQPGRFIEYLVKREAVYAYVLKGAWFDIGTFDTYERANKYFAEIEGRAASSI